MILINNEDLCIITEKIKINNDLLMMTLNFTNKKLNENIKIIVSTNINDNIISNDMNIKALCGTIINDSYIRLISDVVLNNIQNMR